MMAPMDKSEHGLAERQIKDVIQDLYQVMVQVSAYDTAGRSSREVLEKELKQLTQSLQAIHTTATAPSGGFAASSPAIPPELLQYVDNGRNPDIYTREFVELARRGNQLMRGKQQAFAGFRDVLAREMVAALPELELEVGRVVARTGGEGEMAEGGEGALATTSGVGVGTGETR